jgi:type VI secretion system protein ImpA
VCAKWFFQNRDGGPLMELSSFMTPIEGGNPSGAELRNDARFHAIERLVEPANRAARLANIAAGGVGTVAVD